MSHKCIEDKCCLCGALKSGIFGAKDTWMSGKHHFHKKCLEEDMLFRFIREEKYLLLENSDDEKGLQNNTTVSNK